MVKLTPAERKAKKEAKKLAKQLAAEERARQLKRERLTRELEFVHLNWRKLKRQWREKLMQIKLPEFRDDLKTAYATFERVMDLKDFTISSLLEELDDAEHQYIVNFKGHTQIIEQVMRIMGERFSDIHMWYENEIDDLINRYNINMETMDRVYSFFELRLNLASYIREKRWQELLNEEIAEHGAKCDEINANIKILRDKRQSDLEKAISAMISSMMTYFQEHNEKYKDQSIAYETLRKADHNSAQYILNQLRTLQDYTDQTTDLKKAWMDHDARNQLSIGDLQKELNFYNDSYRTLRDRFNESVKFDDKQLKTLTYESKKCESNLTALRNKGENILSMLAICRKHETQMEKVLPFPKTLETISEEKIPNSSTLSVQAFVSSSEAYNFNKEFIENDNSSSNNEGYEDPESEKDSKMIKQLLKPWDSKQKIKTFLESDSFCKSLDSSVKTSEESKENSKEESTSEEQEMLAEESFEKEEYDLFQHWNPNNFELKRFWQHAGAVEMSRTAIIQENHELTEFNYFLKDQVRRHLSYLPFQREVCDPTGGYPLAKRILVSSPRNLRTCLCMEYCICHTAPQ